MERLLIEVFEDGGFERNHRGFSAFEEQLGHNLRNFIASNMRKGIIEILEDHYKI